MTITFSTSDRWVARYVVIMVVLVGCLLVPDRAELLGPAVFLLGVVPALLWSTARLLSDLYWWRPRHGASVALGLLTGVLTLLYGRELRARYEDLGVWARIPPFEQAVERARASTSGPLRLILVSEDRSVFYTPSIFVSVVYDETDEIARSPETVPEWWQTPNSPTGMSRLGCGSMDVRHIKGHFYRVVETC